MNSSVVEYCPKCHAQLPPGLEECPMCGQRLQTKSKDEFNFKDIINFSCAILGIILVPLLIIIGIVWVIILLIK
jgi:ribosomal protein L40E